MSRIPPSYSFPVPWQRTDQPLETQLYRELSREHRLHGITARAVARRSDNDDVLFELFGNALPAAFAIVHLTWSTHPGPDPLFPHTTLYANFEHVVEKGLPSAAAADEPPGSERT